MRGVTRLLTPAASLHSARIPDAGCISSSSSGLPYLLTHARISPSPLHSLNLSRYYRVPLSSGISRGGRVRSTNRVLDYPCQEMAAIESHGTTWTLGQQTPPRPGHTISHPTNTPTPPSFPSVIRAGLPQYTLPPKSRPVLPCLPCSVVGSGYYFYQPWPRSARSLPSFSSNNNTNTKQH